MANYYQSMENEKYTTLMAIDNIDNLSNDDLLQLTGELIDCSEDLSTIEGTNRAYEWCDKLEVRKLSEANKTILEYFRSNLWATRRHIKQKDWRKSQPPTDAITEQKVMPPTMEEGNPWAWEQPEQQEEILCLRKCINSPGFNEIYSVRRCQIYTNLANGLNTVGRPVDAIEYWDRALSEYNIFGKAMGNKGCGLINYAWAIYDQGHKATFLKLAYQLLNTSISDKAFYESEDYQAVKDHFKAQIEWIKQVGQVKFLHGETLFDNYPSGSSKVERSYRKWCLNNRLFLNPLNDITNRSIASYDVLVLPGYITAMDEPPTYLGFFNQIKQEYSSVRWLLYEGTHPKGTHFSDKGVALYDTLDYPSYSLAVEKVKIAYRVIYSLFDKISFFLNDYMELGIKSNKVYFRSIWYEKGDKNYKVISSKFLHSRNRPFRGLFWLSKDLHDHEFATEMEPDAKSLSEIRNQLEHKYLKVHEIQVPEGKSNQTREDCSANSLWEDRLAYSISRLDFESKTLRLMKLARAALVYLCLGMHNEEMLRHRATESTSIFPMILDLYQDDQKQ